jgi:AcrR family transcriptional regulator
VPTSNRSTGAARREEVLDAAVSVFAARGYHGASVQDVARRAAISEPYVYRLYGNREKLFTEAIAHAFRLINQAFREAAEKRGAATPQQLLDAMAERYVELITDGRLLRVQLHAQAAAAAEPAIRTVVRAAYRDLVTDVARWSGAEDGPVQMFFARGMLCHLVVSIGIEDDDDAWANILNAGIRH